MTNEKQNYLITKGQLDRFVGDTLTHTDKLELSMSILARPERNGARIVVRGVCWTIVSILKAIGMGIGALVGGAVAVCKVIYKYAEEPPKKKPEKNGKITPKKE